MRPSNLAIACASARNWSYGYLSLIDPDATDASFATIGDRPYLYYVRIDDNHGWDTRVLFRQRVKLNWLAALHGGRAPSTDVNHAAAR